jgi:nicotinamide mononucleotide transporter
MPWIELVATVFGFLCVWLTIRQNIWCWPVGLVQVFLYCFVFFEAKLYSDFVLHVIYVVLQVYGWRHWLHGGRDAGELDVSRLSLSQAMGWVAAVAVGSAAWGHAMATWTDAALPYADALIAVASLVAQWLMARKTLESWLLWILVDVVAIGVYFTKHLYFTTALYCAFLVLAAMGYRAWRKSCTLQREPWNDENGTDAGQVRAAASRAPIGD